MLTVPTVPDEIVREILDEGYMTPNPNMADLRLLLVRVARHQIGQLPLTPRPDEDLDLEFLRLYPPMHVRSEIIGSIESNAALDLLVEQLHSLSDEGIAGLLSNPRLGKERTDRVADKVITALHDNASRLLDVPSSVEIPCSIDALLASRHLDDAKLATILEAVESKFPVHQSKYSNLFVLAACNASSGPRVFEVFERYLSGPLEERVSTFHGRAWHLRSFVANGSASPYALKAMADLALATREVGWAERLYSNGMLRADDWNRLATVFRLPDPDGFFRVIASVGEIGNGRSKTTYSYEDVVELVMSGEAPHRRLEQLLDPRTSVYVQQVRLRSIDAGVLPAEDIETTIAGPDRHVALACATHPKVIAASEVTDSISNRVSLLAGGRLSETVKALEMKAQLPEDKKLSKWGQLPNLKDVPIRLTDLHNELDGQVIDGLTLEVVKTRRQLDEVAGKMHNCLAGYGPWVEDGSRIVAVARSEKDTYAVAVEVTHELDDRATPVPDGVLRDLKISEINSEFNNNAVPPPFKQGVETLLERINERLSAPAVVERDIEQPIVAALEQDAERPPTPPLSQLNEERSERELQPEVESADGPAIVQLSHQRATVVRPPRRDGPLRLPPPVLEREQTLPVVAPNLLSSTGDVEQLLSQPIAEAEHEIERASDATQPNRGLDTF